MPASSRHLPSLQLRLRTVPLLLAGLMLAACGGGGGSTSTPGTGGGTGTTSTTNTSTTTTPTTSTTTSTGTSTTTTPGGGASAPAPVVIGVAATDAPLLGATIRAVDGAGQPVQFVDAAGATVSSVATNGVDGAYRLTLTTGAPVMPLLIEAVGRDTRGLPVVLHSMVQANTAPTVHVANITPLTDAIIAEMLGADPRIVFQKATANVPAIATLSNAAAATLASDHIKAVVAPALTDAKVTDKTLNFFKDPAFAANKLLVDGALEGLRFQIRADSAGKGELTISNKMTTAGTAEVRIDLATARVEATKSTGASMAKAVTSTLKVTSAPGTSVTAVGTLDTLSAAINRLIAQGAAAEAFAAMLSPTPMPTTPVAPVTKPVTLMPYAYDGRSAAMLQAKLAGYGEKNYQLSKMQVTGCADEAYATGKACTYLAIAANVTSTDGTIIETFTDTATVNKSTVAGAPGWLLGGNARPAAAAIYPIAYASFGYDGKLTAPTATTSTTTVVTPGTAPAAPSNPNTGIQIVIRAKQEDGADGIAQTIAQLPSGYSVRFAQCGASVLCIASTATAVPVYTGNLEDTLLQKPISGWVGNQDGIANAKYVLSMPNAEGRLLTPSVFLPADVPADLSLSLMPLPDGMSASKPLTALEITDGGTFSWINWANTNPNMKIVLIRRIVADGAGTPVILDTKAPLDRTSVVVLSKMASASSGATVTLWLGAEDTLGRRYFSKISGTQ